MDQNAAAAATNRLQQKDLMVLPYSSVRDRYMTEALEADRADGTCEGLTKEQVEVFYLATEGFLLSLVAYMKDNDIVFATKTPA